LRVFLAADAENPLIDQPDRHRFHPVSHEPGSAEVGVDLFAQAWQPGREAEDAVELLLVAVAPPLVVVEVLAAARRVGADRLEMAVGVRTDPHLAPGGWD